MNSSDSPKGPIDQLLLDHVVEGELTDAQQREVLLRLDAEPDGWRRLALTFVEAQRWCREFRALAADADGEAREPAMLRGCHGDACVAMPALNMPTTSVGMAPALAESRSLRRPRIPRWAVAASGLAAAFLLGLALGGLSGGWPGSSRDIAETSLRQTGGASEAVLAPDADGAGEGAPGVGGSRRPAMLRLAFQEPGSDTPRYVAVPVLEASQVPAGLLENPPPAIPVALKRLLEQSGFQVVERTRVQPVQLSDGRRLDLFGSETQVRYVGRMLQ